MTDLIADIGGTNTRCALVEDGRIMSIRQFTNRKFSSLTEVLLHYLAGAGRPRLANAALSVAAPVLDDQVRMVNIDWCFSRISVARTLGVRRLHVVNDFTALAWSLLRLKSTDLTALGHGLAQPRMPRVVLGPGTGLGTGLLVPSEDGGWAAVAAEGGHATLAAANDAEARVISTVRHRVGHVSAERLLSGPGLVLLYATLAEIDGAAATQRTGEQIAALARDGDPRASAVLNMFFAMLGTFAGNLALSVGARGGVYLAGGILPRLLPALQASEFRQRFDDKGRYRQYMQGITVHVITHEYPAFPGLVQLLSQR